MTVAVYQFGDFRLDCGRFELLRSGEAIRLERKPMELLILLVARDGQLATRTEIADRLWSKEIFVDTEHGINTAIRKIRHALGDDPDSPRFVETVTGKGYRFSAAVLTVPAVELPSERIQPASSLDRRRSSVWYIIAGASLAAAISLLAYYHTSSSAPRVTFTQLTDFTDSAVAPAVSPDGRMVAFIRGNNPFLSSDNIYLKILPDGEAKRLTDDPLPKYGLTFSPDGSEVAYTVLGPSLFSTYSVSVLGGESHLLLGNASGLVWLNPHKFLFSEVKSGPGIHLGLVTASDTRSDLREIYFPPHERGMVHYSYPSPDRHWALAAEMDGNGNWTHCRLVSLDGHNRTSSIGPIGACKSAGWSPDGSWMYFAANVEGSSHLWRQRFPDGKPQQITFGPTEEDGIAVEPGGRSLITSVGVQESAIWIHDPAGDRPLSTEGEVVASGPTPSFSSDDSTIYYLWRNGQQDSAMGLWRISVKSGKSEAVLPGIAMIAYDVSPSGKQIVYATTTSSGTTQLWLAPVDRSSPPQRFEGAGGTNPHFGPHGKILFQQTDGKTNYLVQANPDGSNRLKVAPYPILDFEDVSPGRRWAMVSVPKTLQGDGPGQLAIPLDGGPPRRLCAANCFPFWSTSGRFLFFPVEFASTMSPGRSVAVAVGPREDLSGLPPGGITPQMIPSLIRGSRSVPHDYFIPGADPDHYAYLITATHRNLYRVSLH